MKLSDDFMAYYMCNPSCCDQADGSALTNYINEEIARIDIIKHGKAAYDLIDQSWRQVVCRYVLKMSGNLDQE